MRMNRRDWLVLTAGLSFVWLFFALATVAPPGDLVQSGIVFTFPVLIFITLRRAIITR